jgi:RNase adaptor protein for sRNA GlmZ degradation
MQNKLNIEIHSFSYKKGGIPKDNTENGGGFVFDCRGILNPGRIEEYKIQTGNDSGVQEFLETKTEMPNFLKSIQSLISISIENYLSRNFEHLQINFGCTGGQHRSVYSAIKTAEFIRANYPEAEVSVYHDEQLHLNLSKISDN